MTKQELSQIAPKILGIYALLESIQLISGVLNVFSFRGDAPIERSLMVLSMAVPFMVLLWAGTFLIRRTDRITSKYFPSGSIDNVNLKGSQIQAIAFSIIGAVLIVTTIPKLSQLGVNIYSLMPQLRIIFCAISVACLISFAAPVLMRLKTISSATRPPKATDSSLSS